MDEGVRRRNMDQLEEFTIKKYQYWLHRLPGVGNATIGKLLQRFHTPFEVYGAILRGSKGVEELIGAERTGELREHTRSYDLAGEYEAVLKHNIRFLTVEDRKYPERLRKIPSPPYALYVIGELPPEELPAVAVIGARECSDYGSYVAEGFGEALGRRGIPVISGMARGIDGISQRAALNGGGRTYAVLGCGADICYPKSARKLYEEICENGGIISTFPPGTQPARCLFPERNRIVSGLSDAVLVVEARQKSGTFITVDMALEQGREVYAVPGRLTDRLSDGCNLLLQQGAMIALSPEDLLRNLTDVQMKLPKEILATALADGTSQDGVPQGEPVGSALYGKPAGKASQRKTSGHALCGGELSEEARLLLSVLDFHPQSVDELKQKYEKKAHRTITAPELLTLLMQLCMENCARQVSAGSFTAVTAVGYR